MVKKRINWKILIISLIVVYAIAIIGSLVMGNAVNTSWYENIKSPITPPNYVFPIVWNILFFLIAISLYFAWTSAKKKQKNKIIFVYGINLLLNAFWSYLFFNKQNVSGAFYELIVLWFSIWIMIFITWKI